MDRLYRYIEKRDFDRTPEPRDGGAAHLAPRYSIQKHDATATHFDLRLEWDGVLLSWAVTKGPSFQTSEKRLAVRTEDHPLSYVDFEGTIPKGNYGAGTVMLWDIGHWEPLIPVEKALKKGHLEMRLHGARLSGDWHLVRMKTKEKRENWLLIKSDDDAAGAREPVRRYRRSVATQRTMREIASDAQAVDAHEGARPKSSKPQLATLVDESPDGDGWWHELKFDGYRALVALGQGGPRIFTRNGKDWTDRFESLLPAFAEIDCGSALLDGEIVAGAGLDGFSSLQKALSAGGPFRFYGFDVLSRDGTDLTGKPLHERRDALEEMFAPVPLLGPVQLSPVIEEDADEVLERVCAAGGEGLVAKRTDAPYRGTRTKAWRKIKCTRRDEFVVLGWQESDKKGRPFASLALGARDGEGWCYVGKVGTGFDGDQMDDYASAMRPLARKTPPAEVPRSEARGVHWVTPRIVVEVSYSERTDDGHLRHAVHEGRREDKPAGSVRLEEDRMSDGDKRIDVAGISVSSPDREVFPGAGCTKLDVARYYEDMADRILETAADRPLSLVRLPEGLEGERFFQKHAGKGFPYAIERMEIEESDGDRADYMYVMDAAGLVGAAQMGALELHIWGSRRDRLERPDRMVFDLDPDEGLGFDEVRDAAAEMREVLDDLGLPSWPLLTGGKGVHVVVPLRRSAGWDTVKLFSRLVATLMATRAPDRYVAQMSKAKRKGRIFIDWLRNERGATAIAPFSLRARPGAPVAVPVSWKELARLDSAQAFDISSARERDWSVADIPAAVGISEDRVERLEQALEKARDD
ncbi:ATP-dependent DNA ligase LigD phosphoesterase module /ATP-dependent DNA ligase LigD polymerase module [Roseivivax marinus]|uniref:DNA ligase D n=1 Tax=Roseivivax marinus TaxID=1379903 RepID=UPI0008B007E8|nr:DNA ligase D [Roseivivax marinus]SEL67000.1 ATP-dependent DNA ligase LigD phosphoesterase module /ATP-dependent DNA ligase LigD polymerase module [Roseivivax marinus]